ncbi:MAG TPA: hypothetical protein VGQ59_19605 [Cyclobacteriaceae bacterium]|jgi:Zn-dependent membrane protease YugP|nr:hypothetical protein [Cyclobacteriaceae bacterium]
MRRELILSIGTLIGGILLNAFAWSGSIVNTAATICIVAGLLMSVAGFISFILILKKEQKMKEEKK